MRHISTKLLIFWTSFAVCVMGLVVWQSHKAKIVTVDSGHRQIMGTFARILGVGDTESHCSDAIAAAFEVIFRIDELMSDYDPNSMLSQVNKNAFQERISVDEDIFTVLSEAIRYSELSDGAFDVTIGPVVQLWRKAKRQSKAPSETDIRKAQQAVGYESLLLDAETKTVRFAKEGMALDLGGIAKGYAIDKAIEVLQNAGLSGGMVDIGGDLRCFGIPANRNKHWLVGLQNPTCEEDILMVLKMDDRAVATSGDYRRFVVIDGQKHNHIVDPATADSAQKLSSVSIIAPTAMAADALATAVSVLGKEKGMPLIESIQNTEALIIESNQTQTITKTTGAIQYIQEN